MNNINLNGLELPTYTENISLSNSYSDREIIDLMVDNWIPYYECHKCGKWDYCKFAQPHPANPERSVDIKCGLAVDFISNYITTTFHLLDDLSIQQKQHYINTAFYLTEYIQNSEQSVGLLSNKEYLENWGEFTPQLFGMTKETINILTKAHIEMKNIPFFNSKRSVILVEGESEEIFCNTFLDIEVHNYNGYGNLSYSKIEYTIKQYIEKGYKVFIQSDMDGKTTNQNLDKIINKGLVDKSNTFCFKFDFETSIPSKIFHQFLFDDGFITDCYNDFISDYDGKSILEHCKSKYSLIIKKPDIASKICDYIDMSSKYSNLFYDKNFLNTEIGQFWYFLKTKIVH